MHNGLSAVQHFQSSDEFDVMWSCCGKVFLKKGALEYITYVVDETDDDIILKVEGLGPLHNSITICYVQYVEWEISFKSRTI